MQRRTVYSLIFTGVTLAIMLALMELTTRVVDRLPLFAWRLPLTTPVASSSSRDTADERYVANVPLADGVDARWYRHDPPPHDSIPLPPTLAARYDRYKSVDVTFAFRVWNRLALHDAICDPSTAASYTPFDDFFVFDSPTLMPYPAYRHLPNVQ